MEPHIDAVTLAVRDLDVALAFYRDGLGLPAGEVGGRDLHDDITGAQGTIAFVELRDGLMLALYGRANLSKDAAIVDEAQSPLEFSLVHIVESPAEVDELLARAVAAGAALTAPPHRRPWGYYSGYFTDPDGHLWEVGARATNDERD
jgi:uncharacterized protein